MCDGERCDEKMMKVRGIEQRRTVDGGKGKDKKQCQETKKTAGAK